MCKVKKYDYYFGAFLSLLANKGLAPITVEGGKSRKIYKVSTASEVHNKIYVKYLSSPSSNKNNKSSLWSFGLTDNETAEIKNMRNNNEHSEDFNILFAFICSQKDLNDGDVALLNFNELKKCTGLEEEKFLGQLKVNVKAEKNSPNFQVYGNARANDEPLKITRNRINELFI